MGRYPELCWYVSDVFSPSGAQIILTNQCWHLTARNNLRAMKKGDLAFFYHSNCKEPGIVGTMEIVQEHSPDCEFSK